ncbi:hypothetical protein ACFV42_23530 [Streptomyces solisilvae]|uniref:hypothetical protein n=1 Tax=Streptomyces malaysiensis TaxID=92644 RepID=UPI00369E8DA3
MSALSPLILAGVLTRALNRTTQTIKEAVRVTRPHTLRRRLRALTQPVPRQDAHHTDGHHTGHSGTTHHSDYADGSE